MSTAKRLADAGFALTFALLAFVNAAFAADTGLITVQSRYSVKETVARFKVGFGESQRGRRLHGLYRD